ncbi:MAG: hypothetical protein ACE1YV_00735 [Nitrosopumilaceae archaeon]
MSNERNRSLWWILLPIFVGIIGGIIGYFVLKNDDQRLSKFCLHLGIVLTIINLVTILPLILLSEQITPGFGGINI